MSIKIAIAEDKSFLLDSLCEDLQKEADLEVCLKACDGQDFLDKLQHLPAEALPTVVLMDINMPRLNGIQATTKLKAQYPAIQVIMLTVFDEEDMVFQAILAGANGYLLKDEPVAHIIKAVREVENGGAQMSPEIALKALNFLRNTTPKLASKENKPLQTTEETPTKRELEVLQAIAKGLSYQETADALFISLDTVRSHLRKVYLKLYANNKIEAITQAQKRGWI